MDGVIKISPLNKVFSPKVKSRKQSFSEKKKKFEKVPFSLNANRDDSTVNKKRIN